MVPEAGIFWTLSDTLTKIRNPFFLAIRDFH